MMAEDLVEVFDACGQPLGSVERWRICPRWLIDPDLAARFQAIADRYRVHAAAAVVFASIMTPVRRNEPSEPMGWSRPKRDREASPTDLPRSDGSADG